MQQRHGGWITCSCTNGLWFRKHVHALYKNQDEHAYFYALICASYGIFKFDNTELLPFKIKEKNIQTYQLVVWESSSPSPIATNAISPNTRLGIVGYISYTFPLPLPLCHNLPLFHNRLFSNVVRLMFIEWNKKQNKTRQKYIVNDSNVIPRSMNGIMERQSLYLKVNTSKKSKSSIHTY